MLLVPSYQLKRNRKDTVDKIADFVLGGTWSENTHAGGDLATSPPPPFDRDTSTSVQLHRGKDFLFPDELDVCTLKMFPYLQAAFVGQREAVERLFRKEGSSFQKSQIFDVSDVPEQCRRWRWGRRDRRDRSPVRGRRREERWREDPARLSSVGGDDRSDTDTRQNAGSAPSRRGSSRRRRPRFLPVPTVQPQSRVPHLPDVFDSEVMRKRAFTQNIGPHQSMPGFDYHSPRVGEKPDICNTMPELAMYLPVSSSSYGGSSTECRGEVRTGVDSAALREDENLKKEHDQQQVDAEQADFFAEVQPETTPTTQMVSEEQLCRRCCLGLDETCWTNTTKSKKLPRCCIRKLSQFLSPVTFLLKMEVCGQGIGCSGVREGSFVTPG